MTTKTELNGAYRSLVASVKDRFEPILDEETMATFQNAAAAAAGPGRNIAWWRDAPENDVRYGPAANRLDSASRAVSGAPDTGLVAALNKAAEAFDELAAIMR